MDPGPSLVMMPKDPDGIVSPTLIVVMVCKRLGLCCYVVGVRRMGVGDVGGWWMLVLLLCGGNSTP